MHRPVKVVLLAGVMGAARSHTVIRNTGNLSGCRGDLATPPSGDGRGRASEGLIRPVNPGNAGGGKEPWFGVRFNELR